MSKQPITVNARIDGRTFKRFALYDTFILRRRLVSPLLFMAMFLAFALISHLLRHRAAQAGLITGLMLAIGLILPAAYFLHFYLQLRGQVARLGLKNPRPAYFVTLNSDNIRIVNNMAKEEPLVLSYEEVHGVWRRSDALYLYQRENRAFILPIRDMSISAASVWDFLSERLPKEKLHG